MTPIDVVELLEHLRALIPDHAPDMSEELVIRWLGALRQLRTADAREAADALAARWDKPYWPGPADFNFVRRDLIMRRLMSEARAAVAAAPDHPH